MKRRFDVCNGDADGLCAVLQWRLAHPAPAALVTGLKRELDLLRQVPAVAGDEVLVCDLSMQRNLDALQRLLDAGVQVRYVDHHKVDRVPQHPALQACIDTDARVCSSLLMDRLLDGRFRAWALVGAYGDNLGSVADPLAAAMGLDDAQRERLRRLGEGINYNAYGDGAGDQYIAAGAGARPGAPADPLELLRHDPSATSSMRCAAPTCSRRWRSGACGGHGRALGAAARRGVEPARHRQPGQPAGGRRATAGACGAAGRAARRPGGQPARTAERAGRGRRSSAAASAAVGAGAAGIDRLPTPMCRASSPSCRRRVG